MKYQTKEKVILADCSAFQYYSDDDDALHQGG